MVLLDSPVCDFGWKAPDFDLADPSGKRYRLADTMGPNGLLVVFICNHCPYVKAIAPRLAADAKAMQNAGIGVVGIMPNDYAASPEDAPDKMTAFAAEHGFTFPYLVDETQDAARAYGAVCTPDLFGFDVDYGLQYRGRLDDKKMQEDATGRVPELLNAMTAVAEAGRGPREQTPSMGCSIKWRDAE